MSYKACNNTIEFIDMADMLRLYKVNHMKEIKKLAQKDLKPVNHDTPDDLQPSEVIDIGFYRKLKEASEFRSNFGIIFRWNGQGFQENSG